MGAVRHLVIFALTASTAAAEPQEQHSSYTYQVLIADGAAIAVESYGLYLSSSGSGWNKLPGGIVFAVAPAAIHLAHGKPLRGAASFSARAGLTLGAFLLAYNGHCTVGCEDGKGMEDLIAQTKAVVFGAVGALVIEYALIPHDEWRPVVTPTDGGATVAISRRW